MSWNQQTGKAFNKQKILQTIFTKKLLSRNELIEMTGLKKATVANLVSELLQEQLLVEAGKEQSTGGRRSHILRVNDKAGYAIGIDVGVNYLRGEIINFAGETVFEKVQPIANKDFNVYLKHIYTLIDMLCLQVPESPYNILGIGVAIPGTIDSDGIILEAPNLKWTNNDLRVRLQRKYEVPIHVMNEADAGAYAEYTLAPNQSTQNLIYISIGIGIGVGMFINEQFYKGSNGISGESGHAVINMFGRQCTCGRIGCWEAYASEFALLQEAAEIYPTKPVSLEFLVQQADKGHPQMTTLFQEFGKYVAIGITNLIHTLNPDKVVIGNRITKAKPYIKAAILETVQANAMPHHLENCEILFASNEERSTVLGAAVLSIFHFIENDIM